MLSTLKEHLRQNKNLYLAGGIGIAALVAGLAFFKTGNPIAGMTGAAHEQTDFQERLFPKHYGAEPGISEYLSLELEQAITKPVEYDIKVWMLPGSKSFVARTELAFELQEGYTGDLYLSVYKLDIQGILVNNHKIKAEEFDEMVNTQSGYIYLRNDHINSGKIGLTIMYKGSLAGTHGLVEFTDLASKSGDQYVFSSTNIIGASAIYPVFESPAIRAIFRLTAVAPKEWLVLSNEKGEAPAPVDEELLENFQIFGSELSAENFSVTRFRQTKKIPFNSLNICAGKFKEFKTKSAIQGTKISVFGVESHASKIQEHTELIGSVTKAAITKMEKLTGMKFMFNKTQFVVLPDELGLPAFLGINPMKLNREFPGLTTLLLKDCRTFKSEFVYELVVKIVKQWIGQLVTVKWWSQLWFAESLPRYIALQIVKSAASEFGLQESEVSLLIYYLSTQALYHEAQCDLTGTNLPLINTNILNSYDALFLAQIQAEKFGLFKIHQLFEDLPNLKLEILLQTIVKEYGYSLYEANDLLQTLKTILGDVSEGSVFEEKTLEAPLYRLFNDSKLSLVTFKRTDAGLVISQTPAEEGVFRSQPYKIYFFKESGDVIHQERGVLSELSKTIAIPEATHTFLNMTLSSGAYFEKYENQEIFRLVQLIKDLPILPTPFRFKIATVLFSEGVKSQDISLVDFLAHLRILIEVSTAEEKTWLLRSFCIFSKHIDRTKANNEAVHQFVDFLVAEAIGYDPLGVYLGYFGAWDHYSKAQVLKYIGTFDEARKYNEKTSLLNYDLVKANIILLSICRVDITAASNVCDYIGKFNPEVASVLRKLATMHIQDLATDSVHLTKVFKDTFGKDPVSENALEYYYFGLLLRVETDPKIVAVREQFEQFVIKPEGAAADSRKSLMFYNIAKVVSASKRDSTHHGDKIDTKGSSETVGELCKRRFTHHFKLA